MLADGYLQAAAALPIIAIDDIPIARFANRITKMNQFKLCLKNAWLAFSFASTILGLWAAYADGDNLLHSDDPYIIGFLAGSFAAIAACVDTLLRAWLKSKSLANMAFCGILFAWCGFLLVLSSSGGEGSGYVTFASGLSAGLGLFVWTLLRLKPKSSLVWIVSLCTVVGIVLYIFVELRMAGIVGS